jgi:hypothetical protein
VLLKGVDEGGFVFSTIQQPQARELNDTGRAALLFYWPSLVRQVRVSGEKIEEAESDARARPSIGRWSVYASTQSEVIESRGLGPLQRRARGVADIPGAPRWGGYRVIPPSSSSGRDVQVTFTIACGISEASGWRAIGWPLACRPTEVSAFRRTLFSDRSRRPTETRKPVSGCLPRTGLPVQGLPR